MTNLSILKTLPAQTITTASKSLLLMAMFVFLPSQVQANECKGAENEACVANESCGWVESYTRKDGREVKAFCRTSTKGRTKVSNAESKPEEVTVKSSS